METIGDYEYNPKDILGHGAFGMVFKGRHRKNLSLSVAIKRIPKQSTNLSLIGKEMIILLQLHHENIVKLFDWKQSSNNVYLVMEYCKGGDLAKYLLQKKTLCEDTIRLFLIQLANGMKALSCKKIIHRDLKPHNILLTYDGPNPQPSQIKLKIADFGISRILQDGDKAGTVCGTVLYMAPELFRRLPYDAKADLWSLGIIVFECLTGRVPFQSQQLFNMNTKLVPKIPHGSISAELNDLLLKLLKHDAKQRINFEQFFNHQFLRRVDACLVQQPFRPFKSISTFVQQNLRLPVNQNFVQQPFRPPFNQHLVQQNMGPTPFNQQHLRHPINQNVIQQPFIRPFNQHFVQQRLGRPVNQNFVQQPLGPPFNLRVDQHKPF